MLDLNGRGRGLSLKVENEVARVKGLWKDSAVPVAVGIHGQQRCSMPVVAPTADGFDRVVCGPSEKHVARDPAQKPGNVNLTDRQREPEREAG